jgi:hypothetical protein
MPSSNNASAGMGNSNTKSNNVRAAPTVIAVGGGAPVLRSPGNLNGGGYTFTDTAGVALSSYSYNGGTDTHTFNLNTIGVSNETYSILSGANFTSPKWTVPLTYADGSAVLAGDAFSLDVRYDNVSTGASRQYVVCTGVVQDAASTVLGTMRGSGIYTLTSSVGTPGVGIWADNVGAGTTIASMTSGSGGTTFGGAATMVKGGGACVAISGVGGGTNTRADGNSWSVATSSQLFLAFLVSTNGTVTTTAGALSCRIKYAVTKLS